MAETPDESLPVSTLRLRISDTSAGCLEGDTPACAILRTKWDWAHNSVARPARWGRCDGEGPRLVVRAAHIWTAANRSCGEAGPQWGGANPPRRRPVERGRGEGDATPRQPPGDGRTPRCDESHQRVQVHYRTLASVALGRPGPAPENELIPPPLHERKRREPPRSDPPQTPTLPALRAPLQIRARQGGIPLSDGGSSGTRGRIPPGKQPRAPRC